ncbi:MAG: hypothetical protein K9L85_00460 [Candidatus Peribacteraceae bacterium]|nr:hypothetical protein [Candidatus Peribacteraceae bacterium]
MKNSIPENPDIVGIGTTFNFALAKVLAESNPDMTTLLVTRAKNGMSAQERVEHLFDDRIGEIQDQDEREEARRIIQLPENALVVDSDIFLRKFRGQIRKLFFQIWKSSQLRAGLTATRDAIGQKAFVNCEILSASKGIENSTLQLIHKVHEETLGVRERAVVLLGGNLAFDLARGMPMITEIAGDPQSVRRVAELFSNSKLRVYRSLDKNILDVAGPTKNVHSFAAGIASVFSDSTVAASATRGLAEYERIAAAIGSKAEFEVPRNGGVASDYFLFAGTRNFNAGKKFIGLLKNKIPVGTAVSEITRDETVEGIASAIPLRDFARKLNVHAPLIEAVAAILEGKISVRKAAANLIECGRDAEF